MGKLGLFGDYASDHRRGLHYHFLLCTRKLFLQSSYKDICMSYVLFLVESSVKIDIAYDSKRVENFNGS